MYRCTECNSQYNIRPEFCDCGNDSFVEVADEQESYYEEQEEVYRPEPKRNKLSPEEIAEIEADKLDKKKALIAMSVSLFLSVLILAFAPPHFKKKAAPVKKAAIAANVKVPDVNSYWDDTVASPFRKKDPNWNLPILNAHFGSMSPVLRDYIIYVGNEFQRKWETRLVDGSGECKVEFTINKEGGFNTKKISSRSNNDSLDDSVLLLLSKLNNIDIPPDDYKGERVIIAFKVDKNQVSKVYFPTGKKL